MATACEEFVTSVLAQEANEWSCRVADDNTVHLVAPRYYSDGDAIEVLVKTRDNEVVISDGGELLARLETAGVNLEQGRMRDAWLTLLRAHHVDNRHGRVVMRGPADQASMLVLSMLDALANLEGLSALAPPPRELRFSDKLVTFLGAEFPSVQPRPDVQGESGTSYRLTATAGTPERLVYVQAVSGTTAQSKSRAVEHAYTAFSDVNGAVPTANKLVVVGEEPDQWQGNQLRLLARVAYVATWQARERFTQFIWGNVPEDRLIIGYDNQPSLPDV